MELPWPSNTTKVSGPIYVPSHLGYDVDTSRERLEKYWGLVSRTSVEELEFGKDRKKLLQSTCKLE